MSEIREAFRNHSGAAPEPFTESNPEPFRSGSASRARAHTCGAWSMEHGAWSEGACSQGSIHRYGPIREGDG